MIEMQLTYDAFATVRFRTDVLKMITENFRFFRDLAQAHKLIQTRFVAQRRTRRTSLLPRLKHSLTPSSPTGPSPVRAGS